MRTREPGSPRRLRPRPGRPPAVRIRARVPRPRPGPAAAVLTWARVLRMVRLRAARTGRSRLPPPRSLPPPRPRPPRRRLRHRLPRLRLLRLRLPRLRLLRPRQPRRLLRNRRLRYAAGRAASLPVPGTAGVRAVPAACVPACAVPGGARGCPQPSGQTAAPPAAQPPQSAPPLRGPGGRRSGRGHRSAVVPARPRRALRHSAGAQAGRGARRRPGPGVRHRRRRPGPQAGRARCRPGPTATPGPPGAAGASARSPPPRACLPLGPPRPRPLPGCRCLPACAAPPSTCHGFARSSPSGWWSRCRLRRSSPPWVEADVTAIARLRQRAKAEFEAREGVRLSFLPFFALAALEALKVAPEAQRRARHADRPGHLPRCRAPRRRGGHRRGLLVPVIRNAGDLNIGGLARKIADLAQRTRDGQVSPDELAGGTFTLTNTGSRGALFDTPIINQPQGPSWAPARWSSGPSSSRIRCSARSSPCARSSTWP